MNEAVVSLRKITADTVRAICALETNEDQKGFVAANAVSIAQAHFAPSAQFRAVYADEIPVGFIMWRPGDKEGECFLWRFMIDRRHQAKGYGRAALALLLQSLRSEGVKQIRTSYVAGGASPRGFYVALGFRETGGSLANGERLADMTL
jgi:diamine N-acetyltransferase